MRTKNRWRSRGQRHNWSAPSGSPRCRGHRLEFSRRGRGQCVNFISSNDMRMTTAMMWRWWKSRRSRERRERSNCERCCSGRATSGGHGCTADHTHRRNGPSRTMTTRRRPKQRVKNQGVSVTHKKPTSPPHEGEGSARRTKDPVNTVFQVCYSLG